MASPLFNPYPSSTRDMTVSQLVYHFGSSLNHGALKALEERDADWIREIDALRLHCCKQDADSLEFLSRINCLEQELSRQICLRRSSKEFASDSIRENKEQLDRVRAEKADLEQELSRQICLRRSLKEFASDSIQENKEQLDRVRAEKADLELALKADLDRKMVLEAENRRLKALEKELNLRIEALEKEKGEIEAAQLCKAETEKSGVIVMMKRMEGELKALQDETIQLVSNIDVLKREKRDKEIEFCMAEKAKSAEIDMILNENRTLQVLNEGMKGKIAELGTKNDVLEMEEGEIEAEVCRTLQEKQTISQLVDEIGVSEKERREKEAELGRMKEEKMTVEVQKRRAEEFVKVLEKGKTALEKEFHHYRKDRRAATEGKNELIEKITQEKMTLEAELRKAVEDKDHKISKLVKRNEVLVRQKDELDAEIRKAKKHKINDSEEISELKEALEYQKTQMEVAEKHISKILKTVGVLEREKEALDAKERGKGEEINSILKEKMDLEAEKRAMEDEHKNKVLELLEMIEVLKRERMEMEAKICEANRENSEEIKRTLGSKMALEAENRRLKAVEKERNLRIEGLEREKGEIEAQFCKIETEKRDGAVMMKRMEDEVKALKDEGIQLVHNIDLLKREKRDMEIEFRKKESAKSAEIDMVLNKKRSLEVLIQGMKEEISQHAGKNEVLETEKRAEIVVVKRMEDEMKALKDETIELVHNIDVLKREKRDMEIEFRKKESAKSAEIDMVLNAKSSLEVLNQGMKEEISQLANKNEVLEMEKGEIEAELCQTSHKKAAVGGLKSRMEAELKEKNSQLVNEIGVLEKERDELGRMKEEKMALEEQNRRAEESVKVLEKGKTALEDEFYGYREERRAAMEEKNKLIKKITQEKTSLEAELRKVVEDSDRKISKWMKRTEVLLRKKDDMEAEMWKAKKHKIDESEKISKLKEAHLEDIEKRISNFLKTGEVLDREKKAWNVKEREKVEEINSILKEKMDMEAEMRTLKEEDHKKILKLFHMIEVLKREKMEMKSELCQANKEKDEEIKRILNENVAIKAEKMSLKEEGEKKILEFDARIAILEREKRGLDEEIVQKDEVIQVLAQENDSLEDMKKKLRMEINGLALKLKKTVNLFQPVHHPSNVDMLRTPSQNEGKKSLGNFKRKRTNTDACKTKRHSSEDSSGDIGNSSSHVTEDLASCRHTRPTMWEADQDLLDALDGDPELCLEAICALYIQHKSLLSSKPTNCPLSLGVKGLKPDYSSKVIALAEYLIDEDPEGRMKKSVAELEQLDPAAVGECIAIAKQHYKQVFEIYKNKEGPFFLS